MHKTNGWLVFVFIIILVSLFLPSDVFAQIGGIGSSGLATRMTNLTNQVIGFVLPAVSVLGLVYAAILAAMGDQGAKQRIVLVLIASIVGLIAPLIIHWLKSISGVGGL
jgi:hypothetical protein